MKIDMRENRTHKYQHTYINELNISNKKTKISRRNKTKHVPCRKHI